MNVPDQVGTVRLRIASHAANVRLARLVATSIGRMSGLGEQSVDDLRLATGEACGRAVSAQREAKVDDLVDVEVETAATSVTVRVRDHAPADPARPRRPRAEPPGTLGDAIEMPEALDIIDGLTDELEVVGSVEGSFVLMRWVTPTLEDPSTTTG